QGNLQAARKQAQQLLMQAEQTRDNIQRVAAHYAKGATSFVSGMLYAAHSHLERSLDELSTDEQRVYLQQYGADPGVLSRIYLALTQCFMGYSHRALQTIKEARLLADQAAHPFTISFALVGTFGIHQLLREPAPTLHYAEQTIVYCHAHGILQWPHWARQARGWALAMSGSITEGIEETEQGFRTWQAIGSALFGARLRTVLADLCLQAGHLQRAEALIGEALNVVEQTGERLYEAELYRLKGEVLWQRATDGQIEPAKGEIEDCFLHAIAIAQEQQARLWELRATISLGKLWIEQGRQQEAQHQLAEILNWFTEGFETADLQEANRLLEDLQ
ncbi:MAG: hypothetical protein KDE31_38690, partial [Caldilineaceae bacterium]|nr:hypothetical protein [Caldilineaceae bacterium]